jgi:hypothetical protein
MEASAKKAHFYAHRVRGERPGEEPHHADEAERAAPEFQRVLLSRANESVVVDLAIEHAEQIRPEKPPRVVARGSG